MDKNILTNHTKGSKKIIIVGDSHTETGINDQQNSKLWNISQSSETYFFSYFKLKKIFKEEIPSKVILGLSSHNITFFQDEKTFALNNSKRYLELYPRYFYCLNINGIETISRNSDENLFLIFDKILKENLKALLNRKNKYLGKYRESINTNLDTELINKKIEIHYYNNGKVYSISKVQLEYLDKIVKLCKENEVQLYVVNLPTHKLYESKVPANMTRSLYSIFHNLESQGVSVLDYSKIYYSDNHFGDGDHLNSLGAIKITKQLISDINLD